jgi:hypothetical protein
MFLLLSYVTRVFFIFHFSDFSLQFSLHFFYSIFLLQEPNEAELVPGDIDESDPHMNSANQWQNGVDGEIQIFDDNNDDYASWKKELSNTIEYSEQNEDDETQYSGYNDANNECSSSLVYNESYENSARAHSDMIRYNVGVHEYNDGVASRKDKESRSNTFHRVALDFQNGEPNVNNQKSSVECVDSYICPIAIHNLEYQSARHRPPSKGQPLKKQMITQGQRIQAVARQGNDQAQNKKPSAEHMLTQGQHRQSLEEQETIQGQTFVAQVDTQEQPKQSSTEQQNIHGQPSQSSTELVITQVQRSQAVTRRGNIQTHNRKTLAEQMLTQGQPRQSTTEPETIQGQPCQSNTKQVITHEPSSQAVTRQKATRSTNPFANKWVQQSRQEK